MVQYSVMRRKGRGDVTEVGEEGSKRAEAPGECEHDSYHIDTERRVEDMAGP